MLILLDPTPPNYTPLQQIFLTTMSSRSHEIVLGLIKSVKAMNEAEFSDQLDVLFELYPVRTVLLDFVSGTMAEIGSQWERGEMMVMMEHFASNILFFLFLAY